MYRGARCRATGEAEKASLLFQLYQESVGCAVVDHSNKPYASLHPVKMMPFPGWSIFR